MATKKLQILGNLGNKVYAQNEEPIDAMDGALWVDLDAEVHEEPEIVIDTSLSQSGQAADAKAVGDALAQKQPVGDYATETYVDNAIESIPTPDVSGQIGAHNTSTDTHNDIRLLVDGLTTRLNTLADSDDTTLDQMSEIVAYIKANKSLIDSITTNKVNVSDIINNLTTNASNKPLSAAQGVALKALIDAITVPTKLSELDSDATHRLVTDTEKSAWNAKAEVSAIPTKVSELTNDKNYLTAVPSEYVTDSELNAKGYLTAIPSEYVTETELAAKKYLTSYTETDPTVPAWAKEANKPTYTAAEVGALPLVGGTMTGEIVVGQGDGKGIQLGTTGRINATTSEGSATATICGIDGTKALLGHRGFITTLRGKESRPTYNGSNMALQSDVPSKTEAFTFTLADGSTVTKNIYVQ